MRDCDAGARYMMAVSYWPNLSPLMVLALPPERMVLDLNIGEFPLSEK
ncbi:hypothetical protein X733_13625 [Mesorhizobium sp. L2C067A000]|nr:hypothetical protein X733_13625 [Mesorhizobium sp. L2C067A000]